MLLRQVPRVKRYLAYLPEGPDIDWTGARTGRDLADWLVPMTDALRAMGAFAVKMGPVAVVRRWHADTLKAAIAEGDRACGCATSRRTSPSPTCSPSPTGCASSAGARSPTRAPASATSSRATSSRSRWPDAPRTELLAGFNQLWRRNIKKAEKAGVEVVHGTYDDLPAFHEVYVETAQRDRFTPRGLAYFQRMWRAMEAEDPQRLTLYLARHEGRVLAATTLVRVGRHAWYSYGASSNSGRDVRPSNAIQWAMIRDSLAAGCDVYDLRGISDTLDPERPPVRPHPVQARHRRARPGVPRRVGPAAAPDALPRRRRLPVPPLTPPRRPELAPVHELPPADRSGCSTGHVRRATRVRP